jgi:hypothetical protein
MTESQRKLLRRRPKIETVFDYLKQHLHLQTSFPRSMQGYALHYLRILLGYQLLQMGGSFEIQVSAKTYRTQDLRNMSVGTRICIPKCTRSVL